MEFHRKIMIFEKQMQNRELSLHPRGLPLAGLPNARGLLLARAAVQVVAVQHGLRVAEVDLLRLNPRRNAVDVPEAARRERGFRPGDP